MSTHIPTREEAFELLSEYNSDISHIKHGLAVEATMRRFAVLLDEDEQKWGIIGLVHDLDWEKFPEQHCTRAREILSEKGWPADYIRAIMSHAWQMFTDEQPEHRMEKVLYTIDELTGLVMSTALVRPSRSLSDLTAKSVWKKWKEKSFAAGVNREVIEKGAAMMASDSIRMELSDIITHTIEGMRTVSADLGL
ncbi:MAG TPA: hydrolase [Spirochaetia bacterium]|nr:hydrolase [Spirochaetia bacterium]